MFYIYTAFLTRFAYIFSDLVLSYHNLVYYSILAKYWGDQSDNYNGDSEIKIELP